MEHFEDHEFRCKCGKCGKGVQDMVVTTLEKLVEARKIAKIPFILTSAARCEKYNQQVGGSSSSAHLKGHAIDILVVYSESRFAIASALLAAGFRRIGIGRTFVHADDDPELPDKMMWLY